MKLILSVANLRTELLSVELTRMFLAYLGTRSRRNPPNGPPLPRQDFIKSVLVPSARERNRRSSTRGDGRDDEGNVDSINSEASRPVLARLICRVNNRIMVPDFRGRIRDRHVWMKWAACRSAKFSRFVSRKS